MTDPVEIIIKDALADAGIAFTIDGEKGHPDRGLDFYLPLFDLHIECKRMHTDRIAEQCSRFEDVIVVQGIEAAKTFAAFIKGPADKGRLTTADDN